MSTKIDLLSEYQRRIALRVAEMRDDMLAMACYPMHIVSAGEIRQLSGLSSFGHEIPAPVRETKRHPRACRNCGAPWEPRCSYCSTIDYDFQPQVLVNPEPDYRAAFEAGRKEAAEQMQWTKDTLEPIPAMSVQCTRVGDTIEYRDYEGRLLKVVVSHVSPAIMNPDGCHMLVTEMSI